MRGGLKAFWNVGDRTNGEQEAKALAHGFSPVTLINTFADYPGKQTENIFNALGKGNRNPWNRPSFFERIIKRNITERPAAGLYVHDIEINFEEDTQRAWSDSASRAASGAKDFPEFEKSYFAEWARWFTLLAQWTKEKYPGTPVGFYGPQPFRRDYWGISGKDAAQIDGTHRSDDRLWRFIDPYVDYYAASIYVFYEQPDSVFYMAANVEENYLHTRTYGDKPVYAYEWLRYHESNRWQGNRELDPYLVEAMAIVPYFSGAKGVVLWGYEPEVKPGDPLPYEQLPLFVSSLARVAALSDKIGQGKLAIEEPAHALWKRKGPLVRRIDVGDGECVAMALNPWQSDRDVSTADVTCGGKIYPLEMKGQHVTLAHISGGDVRNY